MQPAFMSYLSVSCQISNFVALAHATVTVKSVRPKDSRDPYHNLTTVYICFRRPKPVEYE